MQTPTRVSGQATSLVATPDPGQPQPKVYPSLGPLQQRILLPPAVSGSLPRPQPSRPAVSSSTQLVQRPMAASIPPGTNAAIAKPLPAQPSPAKSAPALAYDISPHAIRVVNVRLAFKALRFNGVLLVALWWIHTSRPYIFLLRQLEQAGYRSTVAGLHYAVMALYLLFSFNIAYSSFRFFFPSASPPAMPSAYVGSNPRGAAHPPDHGSPALRSAPRTRPASPAASFTPRRGGGTPTRLKEDAATQRKPSGGPGSPLAALRAALLETAPGTPPKPAAVREEELKEEAFASRHSPRRIAAALGESEPRLALLQPSRA